MLLNYFVPVSYYPGAFNATGLRCFRENALWLLLTAKYFLSCAAPI